ncbi:transcription-repair coupling factor, partial [bacterium]|nr:transcription-repair coupling factor [bacterium]
FSTVDNITIRTLAISEETGERSAAQNILNQLKTWNLNRSKVAIAVNSVSKADKIRQMLESIGLTVPIMEDSQNLERRAFFATEFSESETSFCIFPFPVSKGFRWIDDQGNTKVALISDEEIFGSRQKQRRVKKSNLKHFFSSLGDLKVGDYVVHVEYGIGKYEGLKKIIADKSEADYLVIIYQDGDKVYVPVDKFHLVQKYTGGDVGQTKLNKLGSKNWAKTKSKVRSEIDDMAEELVRISAIRKAKRGVAFSPDSSMMNEFVLSFPYQETEDQEKAIREVIQDMEKEQPMDRLVCGDVGFGKTEVAMRAAYKTVIDSYQVGIMVPTTILAQQHYSSFKKRFENTPVKIGLLSRFQSPKQIKATLKELAAGTIDVVIGTHRLLSQDVIFKQLGLLVIDEEQRFGVKHKEKIRKFKETVDTLALSATPIPRTLHMSLVGIRDISVINTPPMDRRAIRTRLLKFNDYVIQEAVNREIRRKGQVFFIHNRVESIYQVGQYLNKILPNVRIAVAHGQMSERDLENIMFAFVNEEYDVLLSTTIVESGLDIPNVNTIIINNADQFGLSQLYQLRGRVGRSNVQAYSYLMTPSEKILTETARKRLSILQELNHLGAGFKIASYDLELRGAGNVLGAKQSGHIGAIGFELYTSMIEDAVLKMEKGEKTTPVKQEIVLNLLTEANLPDEYINSMNQRLDAYKTISSCRSEEELWDVRGSLEDRYGKMPEETVRLFYIMQIRMLAAETHLLQLNQSYDGLDMTFSDDFAPNHESLLKFLANPEYKPILAPDNRIKVALPHSTPVEILRFLQFFKKEIFSEKKA